ncbi:MAG: pyruvate dehydrogenase (acetyl-transferring), homodimeric type [Betaproteobacteria bacterium]|nr:pyruvate dehydrogenase (acetyl-transferring), homodimeric type [Betaproteobacteria bacterium]
MTDLSDFSFSGFWRVLPRDADPVETREWLDAFDAVIESEGSERANFILRKLLDRARARRVPLPPVLNTPYCNTISLADQPQYPGNLDIESRIIAIVRWNALAMVVRANREHAELGGHIATYASIADLFEVGFNHFFRAAGTGDGAAAGGGDLVYFQPHASPGVYARAFLEGRLTEEQLANYRRETAGAGLPSYCHPYLMPEFWQFPNASMGVGPITAIYQARFMHYLEHRGILETAGRKVWAFVGDGEMDEPESLAGLSVAAREGLDNLIFVVNCNLQRLDGPVRGNGSIIQELEGLFAGAGWNVVKLLWGSDWDPLFARDEESVILKRLHETVDGEFQKYAATDGRFNREHFFNKYPELKAIVAHLSDEDIDRLHRGGHDPIKIYAAYHAAVNHKGRPTVILAQTKKGYGMGHWGQGKMGAHQAKKLEDEALLAFRDRFALSLSAEDVQNLRFYKPPMDSPEMRYLHAQRGKLGGYLPARPRAAPALPVPALAAFSRLLEGSNGREESTTMAFVRLLSQLLKDAQIGRRVVPIVADEARTFGMQSLFRQVAIYSAVGQLYEPEDRDELLYYKEAQDGQILEEGITEAGAMSSWIAAASAYSAHGVPMVPFYIFYSMFGFQRVGDFLWAAADSRARGFLIGATAGRTTLSGEGLQHQDGSSQLVASTVPNCVSYDPAFGYELAVIVHDGMRRMLEKQEDVFYYITVMNENYPQPAMPGEPSPPPLSRTDARERGDSRRAGPRAREDAIEGILRGMHLVRPSSLPLPAGEGRVQGSGFKVQGSKLEVQGLKRVQLLGSGTILREALAAADMLEKDFGIGADVWSVTSFTGLARDGMRVERWNRLHPEAPPRETWVDSCLKDHAGPAIAATDYVRGYAEQIRGLVRRSYTTLGTDGFGRSDTRSALRAFFEVDRNHIAIAALKALAEQEILPASTVRGAIDKLGIDAERIEPWLT